MKPVPTLLVVVLSALVAFATAHYTGAGNSGSNPAQATVKETRLEQVKRTGTIRCGYMEWPPYFMKDPNTGKFDGILYDLTEEIGKQLKLKIEWTTPTTWGQMLTDLAMNRFDVACVPALASPSRAREAAFATPLFYAPLDLYARKDDTRFDNNFEAANKPEIKFAAQDGQFTAVVADEDFPASTKISVPQMTGGEDLYVMVATKKADVVISTPQNFVGYAAKNPDVLRLVPGGHLRVVALSFPLPANEPAFKAMLDTTVAYLQDSGFLDKVLKKHENPVQSLNVAKHYEE